MRPGSAGYTSTNETVLAFAPISYSTGQTRGWVILEIKLENKVHSYTTAS
jgi:hypothetical protein